MSANRLREISVKRELINTKSLVTKLMSVKPHVLTFFFFFFLEYWSIVISDLRVKVKLFDILHKPCICFIKIVLKFPCARVEQTR